MLKLKNILQPKVIIYLILLITVILTIIRINIPRYSILNTNDTSIVGIVKKIDDKDDYQKITIKIKNKEYLSFNYYKELNNINLNDEIKIECSLEEPVEKYVFNGFDYKEYLYHNNQYYTAKVNDIKLVEKNKNIFYKIKISIIDRVNSFKSYKYMNAFILGNSKLIDEDVQASYRDNGISHLFAISGMHVSFFILFLNKIIDKFKIKEKKKILLISLFLIFYMFLVGFTKSVIRTSLFFIVYSIFKYLKINISAFNVLLLILEILLLIEPFYIYDIGFQYSFITSFYLIYSSEYLSISNNYFKGLLNTSLIASISSNIITIMNFNQINILSTVYNLIFVPLVSFIIFPFSILTFFIKKLDFIFIILITILEKLSLFFSNIEMVKLIMRTPNTLMLIIMIMVTIVTIYFINKNNKIIIFIYIILIFLYSNINYFLKENYITMIDVGQGDSILMHSNNKTMLIDTGGSISYDYSTNRIIPYLKSMGIKKIDYLLLSHGDYDHMGSSYSLVSNFKIKQVVFNSNEFNNNENRLIKILKNKNIDYCKDSAGNIYKVGDFINKSINNNDYDNENDSSIVLYTLINNNTLLFTGDISTKVENNLIKDYHLNVNILKAAHHGSKTSTSNEFIDKINPDVALISVGLTNKYNHPSKEVLNNLKNSDINYYLTSINSSIKINFKNNWNIITIK